MRSHAAELGEMAKAMRAASAHTGKDLPFVRHQTRSRVELAVVVHEARVKPKLLEDVVDRLERLRPELGLDDCRHCLQLLLVDDDPREDHLLDLLVGAEDELVPLAPRNEHLREASAHDQAYMEKGRGVCEHQERRMQQSSHARTTHFHTSKKPRQRAPTC